MKSLQTFQCNQTIIIYQKPLCFIAWNKFTKVLHYSRCTIQCHLIVYIHQMYYLVLLICYPFWDLTPACSMKTLFHYCKHQQITLILFLVTIWIWLPDCYLYKGQDWLAIFVTWMFIIKPFTNHGVLLRLTGGAPNLGGNPLRLLTTQPQLPSTPPSNNTTQQNSLGKSFYVLIRYLHDCSWSELIFVRMYRAVFVYFIF